MRTTLTLDSDVAAQLRAVISQRHVPMKVVVNDALRTGLCTMTAKQGPRRRFETPVLDAGECLIGSLDCVSEALAIAEGDDYK